MNSKKTFLSNWAAMLLLLFCGLTSVQAQVAKVKFYKHEIGQDSVTLFFSLFDKENNRISDKTQEDLKSHFIMQEDGKDIAASACNFNVLTSGKRIPADYTFSVLVDRSIPGNGLNQIYQAVENLVNSAPDGCVFLSFFDDAVSSTEAVNADNISSFRKKFQTSYSEKVFYSAVYAKLCEFNSGASVKEEFVEKAPDYKHNDNIASRAKENKDKNILVVFAGSKSPRFELELDFSVLDEYQNSPSHLVPVVYALYYDDSVLLDEEESFGADGMETTLRGICNPLNRPELKGEFMPVGNIDQMLEGFMSVVNNQMYDYSYSYCATPDKSYTGNVDFVALWSNDKVGEATYLIGSPEKPWPNRPETAGQTVVKYIMAIVVALFTIFLFFFVMKVLVPSFKQRSFKSKYYKRFVPDEKVQRRVCTYCRQEIREGQLVVARCKHVMHAHCWKENGYKCAEFGQNCTEGSQSHIDWSNVFTFRSLMDCHQTVAGVLAGLLGWVVFELTGHGLFDFIAEPLVKAFVSDESVMKVCVEKTSAFLTIGMLLGFFLSFIFRSNDEYRRKNFSIWMKIFGLSLLTAVIGMAAFALGAMIFCMAGGSSWILSLPAYLLFSIAISLALTIKSTIPMKSALLGGLLSAVIGFFVLILGSLFTSSWNWMGMLLNFIIYAGGLGAALVTVRMLAEKYFLEFKVGTDLKRIPIHKWMGATGGGNRVNIGMTNNCEIQMNWEKTNKVAKQHAQLYIDTERNLPMLKPLAGGVLFNGRTDLEANKPVVLSEGDTFKVGDTTFRYTEKMD